MPAQLGNLMQLPPFGGQSREPYAERKTQGSRGILRLRFAGTGRAGRDSGSNYCHFVSQAYRDEGILLPPLRWVGRFREGSDGLLGSAADRADLGSIA